MIQDRMINAIHNIPESRKTVIEFFLSLSLNSLRFTKKIIYPATGVKIKENITIIKNRLEDVLLSIVTGVSVLFIFFFMRLI